MGAKVSIDLEYYVNVDFIGLTNCLLVLYVKKKVSGRLY